MIDSLVLWLDEEGNILDMNRACRRVTGFELDEVRAKPFVNVFATPGQSGRIHDKIRQAKRSGAHRRGRELQFESELVTRSGERRRVLWSLSAIRDENGMILSLAMTGTDRTQLLESEIQLSHLRSRAEEAAALASQADAMLGINDVVPGEPFPPLPPEDAPTVKQPTASSGTARPSSRASPLADEEKRSSPRRAFRNSQRIAPVYGGRLPSQSKLFEVECEDISTGGIAFYMNRPPDFDTLVVALGRAPDESYLLAEVARVARIEREEGRRYLVGCRFTDKVAF